MKICVLNGSPKGQESVTMQYVRFLSLAFPAHTFVVEDVAHRIGALEKNEAELTRVIASVSSSDAVLFATPVYFMLVPAQFKRFIELVFSHNAAGDFSGKVAASITTSIHFYDHTANGYLHAVAEDLGMKFAGSFMAKMDDLFSEGSQQDLLLFGQEFFEMARTRPELQRTFPPIKNPAATYQPAGIPMPLDTGGKDVVILSDAAAGSNLERMVTRLASCFGRSASVVPVDEAKAAGGCLGCCRCAFDNTCVYKDGFCEFWKQAVLAADIVVFAVTIKDRAFSSAFKQILDRSFFLGHVPALQGKQVAYLVSGPLSQCPAQREAMTAYVSLQGANLAGVITDEEEIAFATDGRIDALAVRCIRLSGTGYIAPGGFPEVGGRKIFRDEIWGGMRPFFRADHAYFRAHGMYDFPQNNTGQRIRTALFSLFLAVPQVQKEAQLHMNKHMIEPYAKVLSESRVLARWKEAGRK